MLPAALRNSRLWLGIFLVVGGVVLLGAYFITPTYVPAMLSHR
jgi:hypothetical protein